MTPQQKIDPERVTKPMQLLAAWLVGLIVVDGSFLLAAARMEAGSWERGALVAAAIANVPVFLFALFLLQTRFRPELQEDSYYSQYLDKRTNKIVTVGREESMEKELLAIRTELRLLTTQASTSEADASSPRSPTPWRWKLGLNRHLRDFTELREILKRASIPLNNAFGGTSPPVSRLVALAEDLDFESKMRVLRLALDMRMDGYTYFDPSEQNIDEDILIGSYGHVEYTIVAELQELLDSDPEPVDLQAYEERNRRFTSG